GDRFRRARRACASQVSPGILERNSQGGGEAGRRERREKILESFLSSPSPRLPLIPLSSLLRDPSARRTCRTAGGRRAQGAPQGSSTRAPNASGTWKLGF